MCNVSNAPVDIFNLSSKSSVVVSEVVAFCRSLYGANSITYASILGSSWSLSTSLSLLNCSSSCLNLDNKES